MIPPKVRDLVWTRANSCCERCGRGLTRNNDHSLQHRVPRKMGGSKRPWINGAANLALLCGTATTQCHGLMESKRELARSEGYLLSDHMDPAASPILHWSGEWRHLNSSGTYGFNMGGVA